MKRAWMLLVVCALPFSGCDEGLAPVPGGRAPLGAFSGTIRYRHWPVRDSLQDLRLIAFRTFPPRDIASEAIGGTAVIFPPIGDTSLVPFYVDSLRFVVPALPGEYRYVVVAQKYGPDLYHDWRAVGQYDTDADPALPTSIVVTSGDTLRGIDISADFLNLPPQPFP